MLANAPPAVKLLAAVQVTPVVTSGVVPLRAPLPSKLSEKITAEWAEPAARISAAREKRELAFVMVGFRWVWVGSKEAVLVGGWRQPDLLINTAAA